jgi:hypothetical protein
MIEEQSIIQPKTVVGYYKNLRYPDTIYAFILMNAIFRLNLYVLEYKQLLLICLFTLQTYNFIIK